MSTCSCGKPVESNWNTCPNCGKSLNAKPQKGVTVNAKPHKGVTVNITRSAVGGKTSIEGSKVSAKLENTVFGDDLDITGEDDVAINADNIRVVGDMNVTSKSGQGESHYPNEHTNHRILENVEVSGNLTIAETLITFGEGRDAILLPVSDWLKKMVEENLPSDGNYTATDIDNLILHLDKFLDLPIYSNNATAAAEIFAYKAALYQKRGNKQGSDGRREMDVALDEALARNSRQELALKLKAYYNLNKWKQLTLVWKPSNKNRLSDTVNDLEKFLQICNKISITDKLQATEKLMSCLFVLKEDPSDGEQSELHLQEIIVDLSKNGHLNDLFPNWAIWKRRIDASETNIWRS